MPRPHPTARSAVFHREAQLRAGAKKPRADEGGAPEAKHSFAKRERVDTDVGPGRCTGIIIAAGRQRQQPTEAAGASLQTAQGYLARIEFPE